MHSLNQTINKRFCLHFTEKKVEVLHGECNEVKFAVNGLSGENFILHHAVGAKNELYSPSTI